MQDQRGNLDESHVPAPRHPAEDGAWADIADRPDDRDGDGTDDTAVGTAHTDHEHDSDDRADDVREGETYPAGTYASGSALTDADHDGIADRDDVEVVDHDRAIAGERAGDDAGELDAREEDEARGDADFVPGDVTAHSDDDRDTVRTDERDEAEAAAEEDAEDRAWAADHATQLRAGSLPEDQAGTGTAVDRDDDADDRTAVLVDDADDRTGTDAVEADARTGDHVDAYADDRTAVLADDAAGTHVDDADPRTDDDAPADSDASTYADTTSGSDADADVDVADDTDADTEDERRDDTLAGPVLADEPVATGAYAGTDEPAASEALEGGEALDAGDVVAVPVPAGTGTTDAGAGQDLRPGAVEPVPVGALWADGAAEGLRERWRELQLRFIDDPRSVAGEADQLVAEAVSTVTGALESQRSQLSAWQSEGGEDTERLRAAVRQYRDFLDRLLGL
ncbi:hypothetical protein [Dactylosporangium sp. NPDC005555]|uniref:hypothetical protein n=1 Tax=Dactylosporangium sp. NPDC005555 TaxID=3154889 RepID=UPI0033B12C47